MQEKLDQALASFRKAVELNPKSAWCYCNLGEAVTQKDSWQLAINYYRKALELNPEEVQLWQEAQEIQLEETNNILVDNPVFIVGCGHSGTSLMLAILDNHSSFKYRIEYQNFEERLNRWIYDNMVALPYWDEPNVKICKYEDLSSAPEKTIGDILSFLEVEEDKNILDFYQTKKYWYSNEIIKPNEVKEPQDHLNLRNWQINQPIFDGRGRWQREMTKEQKEIFKQKAQKYLVKFGYVEDDNW